MTFSIVYERIDDGSLPEGYYYAYIPSLDLTTHGEGIEGAKEAALDLVRLWITEKKENNEQIPHIIDSYFSKLEIEDAIFSS